MGMRINGVQDSFVVVSYDFEYTTEVRKVSEVVLVNLNTIIAYKVAVPSENVFKITYVCLYLMFVTLL